MCRMPFVPSFPPPITPGNPWLHLKGETGEMWRDVLEALHTGAHCAAIPNNPFLFLSAPLYFYVQLISRLILFVDLTLSNPLSQSPFKALLSFLDSRQKENWVMVSKTHMVEMLNENTDGAKKKRERKEEKKVGCRGPNSSGSMCLSPQEIHVDSLLCSHIL